METFYPAFSLTRLLKTVFAPKGGERVAILIDLENPADMKGHAYLKDSSLTIQAMAHEHFYEGLKKGVLAELGLQGGEMFAYHVTGGSNLDLPDTCVDVEGRELNLTEAIYQKYNIILCISTYSATAPLTAFAKKFGFRGATLHGLNPVILTTGLSVDYNEVSRQAEKLRLGLTRSEWVELDFEVNGRRHTLRLQLGGQEAQKSHGLCRGEKPDVANLPAGEVYFVPEGAEGEFPMKYKDGSVGLMKVSGGCIREVEYVAGNQKTIEEHRRKLADDPMTGALGELGFGTQVLPVSGRDIQDEKVLGTFHVATGRSDHLGGKLTPDLFKKAINATHDDILFAPHKTPEIKAPEVRMHRAGKTTVVLRDYQPADYLVRQLAGISEE